MNNKAALLASLFLTLSVIACGEKPAGPKAEEAAARYPVYSSYKDIPGVTAEEITAIDALKSSGKKFIMGMNASSECFEGKDGIGGFSALFCKWLSDLFGITFTPVIYEWADLLREFESGRVDFTGELTATPARLTRYSMTGAIAERAITIANLKTAQDPAIIARTRKPRFGFLAGSTTRTLLLPQISYEFESFAYASAADAYTMLRERKLDAFFDEGQEGDADAYKDLKVEPFLPLTYSPISLATANPDLKPVITVLQKYLDEGALYHLVKLYNQGNREFLSYRFNASLTDAEREYVKSHSTENGAVKFLMERDNYPIAFYNEREGDWEGIAWDLVNEISAISGLRFSVLNDSNTTWAENMENLRHGKAAMISELLHTTAREEHFIWSEAPYVRDNYALISKVEQPDISINEILYLRVGIVKATANAEMFKEWFPAHPNTVEYASQGDAFGALDAGDIDVVMGKKNTLLSMTNYLEKPGYKANFIFTAGVNSSFGFNRRERVLCSVVSKAQDLIDTQLITDRWLNRVFDYRSKMIRYRQPYLIGFCVALGVAILLLTVVLFIAMRTGKKLETMVDSRTKELQEKTAQLEKQKEAEEAAYKVKSRFLANMSHELRTPLNAIIGLSQSELDSGEVKTESLATINKSGSSLLSVINDLLDISNIESGDMELRPAAYSLAEFLSGICDNAKVRIGEKPLNFKLELESALPAQLYGDEHRVKQIVSNLLSNAIKFTRAGSVSLKVRREKTAGFSGGSGEPVKMIFEVRDTGTGIKAEDMKKLFADYNQIDSGSSRSADGTGMGLLITKKLAEMMDGGVTAQSEYGSGSIFTASIRQNASGKLDRETAEQLCSFTYNQSDEEKKAEKAWLPYAKVLVVDDVPTNLAVASSILKTFGISADTANSGLHAIERIKEEPKKYDAIFMDHMMPEMDGMEAVKLIRTTIDDPYVKKMPIIALTANAAPGNEELFLKNGFDAFMTKPIKTAVLNKVLLDLVKNKDKEKAWIKAGGPEKQAEARRASITSGLLLGYAIDGVDLDAGAAQFGGEEAYLEIIKVFITNTPKLLESIKDVPQAASVALEALKNYTIAVHGIKGSCYGICATDVGRRAEELEHAAREGNLGEIVRSNGPFIEAAQNLVEKLSALFPKKDDADKPSKNAPDKALLAKLKAAAAAYNIDAMTAAMQELDGFNYTRGGDLVDKLREAVESYEYKQVIDLIKA